MQQFWVHWHLIGPFQVAEKTQSGRDGFKLFKFVVIFKKYYYYPDNKSSKKTTKMCACLWLLIYNQSLIKKVTNSSIKNPSSKFK